MPQLTKSIGIPNESRIRQILWVFLFFESISFEYMEYMEFFSQDIIRNHTRFKGSRNYIYYNWWRLCKYHKQR
jgi:hypothetical protein